MNRITAASCQTPDGVFTVLASESAVLASGWTDDAEQLLALIHPTLRGPLQEGQLQEGQLLERTEPRPKVLIQALEAVQAYYDGDHTAIAGVPVSQRSGPFRQSAWDVLRSVAPGSALTYTEYAAQAGSPGAVRAAASACAMNAAALFVPCHRVLRADGSLGGFRYGLGLKQSLLAREAAASR